MSSLATVESKTVVPASTTTTSMLGAVSPASTTTAVRMPAVCTDQPTCTVTSLDNSTVTTLTSLCADTGMRDLGSHDYPVATGSQSVVETMPKVSVEGVLTQDDVMHMEH